MCAVSYEYVDSSMWAIHEECKSESAFDDCLEKKKKKAVH